MTGWTLFFTILGVAMLTAQLFRVIDLIERPTRHARAGSAVCRKTLPDAWAVFFWRTLGEKQWTFWKS